jgi:16S rRNA (cytosine1402-N4)-methyltransferase
MHQAVLLQEAVDNLIVEKTGTYIDTTLGRGGHSRAILQALNEPGQLIAIDQDRQALDACGDLAQQKNVILTQANFSELIAVAKQHGVMGKVSGILFDLGVSSPQLDEAPRGFSFLRDGPLDMRMNPDAGEPVSVWLHQAPQEAIQQVLKTYGEEKFARRIASAIVNARQQQPITTTLQLAQLITDAVPKKEKHKHPATRSFQALRIFINRELESLEQGLSAALEVLQPGGRLAVISFHSLEDRLVKNFIRQQARGEHIPKQIPIIGEPPGRRLHKLGKVITPSADELGSNPRARSAKLRIAEKII